MNFKPARWYPIAAVLSVVNVGATWFAAMPGGALHATAHAGLAVAFGVWAERLRRRLDGNELNPGLERLELEMDAMRRELSEAQERIDFAERLLAQGADPRRVDARRPDLK